MLVSHNRLLNCPVLSVHVAGEIAVTTEPVIDPDKLRIVAFRVDGPLVGVEENGDILRVQDIREYSSLGMVVDSISEFVSAGDVVALDKVLEINFELPGLKVETKKGTRLGKVSGYTVNTENYAIQQLTVQRPMLKSFTDPELIVGRSEVIEVTDDKIIVKDEEAKIRENAMRKDFIPNFVNPFREPQIASLDSQSPAELDRQ